MYFGQPKYIVWARGGAHGWGTALQAGRSRIWFPLVSVKFFVEIILPAAVNPGVDSAPNRNKYQEYFLGDKGSRCAGLTNNFRETW